MIAQETFRRFTANWGPLALAGLFALLVNMVAGAIGAVAVLPVLLSTGVSFLRGGGGLDSVAVLVASAGVSMLLMAAAVLLLTPIGLGGLLHGVIQVQRGQPASFGELWHAGLRNWTRILVLNLISFLVMIVLVILLLILRLVPILGPLVWFIGTAMIMLALGGYGAYIAVSEQVSGVEAALRALRILSVKFADLLMTLLVLAAAGLALGLVTAILSRVPILGSLVPLATQIVVTPLFMLYLATRYEHNIAPDLGPPGGQGRFDPGPPPGA
ncbi:MAG TPA: hypothetical protein VNT75_09065 [Symbiobacteriaceae bacterium]|nr:hypothetical protein [Symbiobacteriaceae bacterium]